MAERSYQALAQSIKAAGSRQERMKAVVDALWEGLRDKGVSWVGIYVEDPDAIDQARLVLGPCRDKPACSPIGVHGVCGQTYRFRSARIVNDVAKLGDDYIACDPSDRSEVCVPLLDDSERCWGVLDLDSHDLGAFSEADEQGLRLVIKAAGL